MPEARGREVQGAMEGGRSSGEGWRWVPGAGASEWERKRQEAVIGEAAVVRGIDGAETGARRLGKEV